MTVYTPSFIVLTAVAASLAKNEVRSPSMGSLMLPKGSIKGKPASVVTSERPLRMMSGSVGSITLTVTAKLALLRAPSVAE